MRVLIISDLHANLEAVRALPAGYDRLLVLGDLVNYGPDPAAVVQFVRERAATVVRGNHDHSIGFDEDPRCSARFRAMAEEMRRYTASVLTEQDRQYLHSLPVQAEVTLDRTRFFLCHAVPSDLYQYRPEDSPLWLDEAFAGADVALVGHTHIPFGRVLSSRLLVNPGSVGQPKNGRAEACYAVWEDGRVKLESVPYDVEETVRKLSRLPLSATVFDDLAFVLRHGAAPPQ